MENATTCLAPKPKSGIQGLDAYRIAVEFYRLLRHHTRGRRGHVIDQSYRAAESVILNIADLPFSGGEKLRPLQRRYGQRPRAREIRPAETQRSSGRSVCTRCSGWRKYL